jgi:uncharacterized protein YxeA
MKKVMAVVLALFFVTATSGLVLAANPSATPTNKSTKHGKKKHHSKKTGNTEPSSKSEKTK